MPLILGGDGGVVVSRYGRKVENGRAVERAAGRGALTRVVRCRVVRGCCKFVLCLQVRWGRCLQCGLQLIFDKNGVRKLHDAYCRDALL